LTIHLFHLKSIPMKALVSSGKIYLGFALVALLFVSCTKDEENTPSADFTYDFPAEVFNILTKEQIDAFRQAGMPIYEGQQPPIIADEIIYDPDYFSGCCELQIPFTINHNCIFDNKASSNVGTRYDNFVDSIEVFREQNRIIANVKYTSQLDNGSGRGFASGSGENFSLFFKVENGVVDNVRYQAIWVISGTVSRNANKFITDIKNVHDCFLMLQKANDPDDKAANPGTIRIFKDPDGISERRR
jgi:hypothetical protein